MSSMRTRPLIIRAGLTGVSRVLRQTAIARSYHSLQHEPPAPDLKPAEASILAAALEHVPVHGFTKASLTLGARDRGYLDITANLFPRGAFDLIHFYLMTERVRLKDALSFEGRDG